MTLLAISSPSYERATAAALGFRILDAVLLFSPDPLRRSHHRPPSRPGRPSASWESDHAAPSMDHSPYCANRAPPIAQQGGCAA